MDVATFLGRLHPVVVHLPIGFILLAAAFDLLAYAKRYSHLRSAVAPALLAGFLSAALSSVLGLLLSLSGSYDESLLAHHRNAGIVLSLATGIWWLLEADYVPRLANSGRRVKTTFGVAVMLVLVYTGHQGGSLTHGSDFLSIDETAHTRTKPRQVADALVFDDIVLPILERRCESCHRRGKRKGDLVVSTYAELMKGGENGAVIVAGSLKDSDLYRRITLDPSHDDFMPTDGKKPLTDEETDVIRWWIEKAEAANDKKFISTKGHEELLPFVSAMIGAGGNAASDESVLATRPPNPDLPVSVNTVAIDNLRKNGMMVRIMLHEPAMLDITLPAGSKLNMRDFTNDLRSVSKNVVWLNLSGNELTTADLVVLKEMSNLEKLRLDGNPVKDDVVDVVRQLNHLEALNINSTEVTEKGYQELIRHPSLRRVYWWSDSRGK